MIRARLQPKVTPERSLHDLATHWIPPLSRRGWGLIIVAWLGACDVYDEGLLTRPRAREHAFDTVVGVVDQAPREVPAIPDTRIGETVFGPDFRGKPSTPPPAKTPPMAMATDAAVRPVRDARITPVERDSATPSSDAGPEPAPEEAGLPDASEETPMEPEEIDTDDDDAGLTCDVRDGGGEDPCE